MKWFVFLPANIREFTGNKTKLKMKSKIISENSRILAGQISYLVVTGNLDN